jgi:hypothetical protein
MVVDGVGGEDDLGMMFHMAFCLVVDVITFTSRCCQKAGC